MGERKPLDLEFLQRGPRIRAGRVKVLVAFGDVTGFGAWTRRGSNSPEEFKDFMVHLYKEFIRFRNGNGYFVKLMGDGFMCITEIDKGNSKARTLEFLNHAVDLELAIQNIVKSTFPAPGSFRIRIAAGHVWKMVASRPGQGTAQTDYLGYAINLAARLLEIDRESAILCHESVRKILNGAIRSSTEFGFKPARIRSRCPRGVDPEDIQTLWKVYPLNDSKMAMPTSNKTIPK
jgi:class 3 adenylate cyclase